ncbi:hypothetical protein HNI00_21990 [Thermoleptolyngbya oregonensis NK1-22]|uniref:Uncharacterized protein n=1 Tax=Thermoleptolyngbya oregonensis NK1-22 TaxID=2547457 RepID=A0AA97BAZ2_9CYAN|nr:hypothetical protein [Thermoleptolyngbya oregonensis]WOB45505.1 hypothetical protein HNI00_21990 [Thermoleptolyngbya oregonensis NK1-22]
MDDRPSSPCTRTFRRSPSSGSTDTFGRSPSFPNTDIFGRSPPRYLLGRCTLTQVCRYSTSAADPKAAGSVRLDLDLEKPSLRNLGGESPTQPEADRTRALRANGEAQRRAIALGLTQSLCSVRCSELLALSDRPSSPCTRTFRRSPSFPNTDIFGRSPPGYLLGRCTLTEVYRYSTSAADPEAAGSVRLDPDLEEPSLRNLGGESLTQPEADRTRALRANGTGQRRLENLNSCQ